MKTDPAYFEQFKEALELLNTKREEIAVRETFRKNYLILKI